MSLLCPRKIPTHFPQFHNFFFLGNMSKGQLKQPPQHPRNGYFEPSRYLLRSKEDGRISYGALDHLKCKDPVNPNRLHLISEWGSLGIIKVVPAGFRVKGTGTVQAKERCFSHAVAAKGEGKRGQCYHCLRVSSWWFCTDPADAPIP